MQCSVCQRPMMPLFISYVCDYCDGLKTDDFRQEVGYVVWRKLPLPALEYVFSTPGDARKWRVFQGLSHCDIREVISPVSFRWRKTAGVIRDLEAADSLIEIYGDHRYTPGPGRASLGRTV